MSGLDRKTPIPTEITLHKKSRVLELGFEDGTRYQLPAEFLRVYSPSAEVRGHGPGQETLQTGKRNVEITDLEAVGNYAVNRLHASLDGLRVHTDTMAQHATGDNTGHAAEITDLILEGDSQ